MTYTFAQKAEALRRLQRNLGNIAQTSLELDIPVRTLSSWRQQYREFLNIHKELTISAIGEPENLPKTPVADLPPAAALNPDQAADEFAQLRMQLMNTIMELASSTNLEPIVYRAAAISRLLTWVIKLDETIPVMRPEQVLRLEYKYPDGSTHQVPWEWRYEEEEIIAAGGLAVWEKFPDT